MSTSGIRHNVSYGNDMIQTVDGGNRDEVRMRPTIYFNSIGAEGNAHGTKELVTNVLDEILNGNGSMCHVEVTKDNVIKVIDNCSGVPMGWNPVANKGKGGWNWDIIYNRLYGSGKYNDKVYKKAAGLNGMGAAVTQFASERMKVISRRYEEVSPGKYEANQYTMNFKDGRPDGELIVEKWDTETGMTGTYVEYVPSREVFTVFEVPKEIYVQMLKDMAVFCPNATITFKYHDDETMRFEYKHGMEQYLTEISKGSVKKFINISMSGVGKDGDNPKFQEYEAEVNVTFSINLEELSGLAVYHNGILMAEREFCVTYKEFLNGLKDWATDFGRKSGLLKDKDKISITDVRDVAFGSIVSSCPGFLSDLKGQSKTAIQNVFIGKLVEEQTVLKLGEWAVLNKEEALHVIETIVRNKDAREQAEKVRKSFIKSLTKDTRKIGNEPDKLTDCTSKNPEDCELYIVEGDSAKGTTVTARNCNFQAVFPLIGKILNCVKKPLDKALMNKVIRDLLTILGCGVEARSKHMKDLPPFDISKLRYHKIVICTDADVDGAHIAVLLLCMLYRLVPSLIREGYVYRVIPPLYEIRVGKEEKYVFDDAEKDAVLAQLKKKGISGNKVEIIRFKGLGEMTKSQMASGAMNPETRRLERVMFPEDNIKFAKTLESLMGTDPSERRSIVEQRFFDYADASAIDAGIDVVDAMEMDAVREIEYDEEYEFAPEMTELSNQYVF